MVRTQVHLTIEQKRGLERLAAATGKRQSDMIREAVAGYLADRQATDWRTALEAARGIWPDHASLDALIGDLRTEGDRRDRMRR